MKTVKLRALEPDDIERLVQWENDSSLWQHCSIHQPISRHALAQYIMDTLVQDIYASRQLRLMAIDAQSNDTVGSIDLTSFDPFHLRAEVGLAVDSDFRGQGYGRLMVIAMSQYARQHLHLHQLYCNVAANNEPSLRLFDSCGFRRQAIRHDWIATPDGWIDAVLMAKIL